MGEAKQFILGDVVASSGENLAGVDVGEVVAISNGFSEPSESEFVVLLHHIALVVELTQFLLREDESLFG